MTYLDDGMSRLHLLSPGDQLLITVSAWEAFSARLPEIAIGLVDMIAACNGRSLEAGSPPMLVVAPV